jgi:hypothetical protein
MLLNGAQKLLFSPKKVEMCRISGLEENFCIFSKDPAGRRELLVIQRLVPRIHAFWQAAKRIATCLPLGLFTRRGRPAW